MDEYYSENDIVDKRKRVLSSRTNFVEVYKSTELLRKGSGNLELPFLRSLSYMLGIAGTQK